MTSLPLAGYGGASPPSGSGGSSAGGGPVSSSGDPKLPAEVANCPTFKNGATVKIPRKNSANGSMSVVIYIDANAKSKPDPGGPLILYYHATGGQPSEVHSGFGDQNIAAVTSKGGVVASFTTTSCPSSCATTDDFVWWAEDADVQDTVVACAIQQAKIDTRRIHALGWSAGALHASWIGLARSNYMASVISYSGGYPVWPGTDTPQDASNHVASIMTYGDSSDVVVVSFPTQSKSWYSKLQPKGYYTMMCNHPGGHKIDTGVAPLSLQFFLDHPYKVSPEPYAGMIPSGYPSYCKNAP